ncbi:MAG: hypothetical protein IJT28_06755 [Bacteroidaceae bacterium]|nr:hypothetical protein [Bacteroidaceae bacterium]
MHYELCIKIAIFATQNSYMHKGLYIIGLLLLLFVACTGDREVRAVLERAERYLPDMPDSADALLQSIDSPPLRESGERVRSLYGLLRTMTDAMQGKGVTTDSLIRPAYEYYKERGASDENTRRLGRSAFYLARFEASRDSTKRAEDLFREAIRCTEKVEDWRTCYMAYNYFASTITWSNTELAIQLRKKAIDIYNKCKDKPANYIAILNFLSNDFIAVGVADSAFHCTEEAYQIACDYQLEDKKYSSLRTLSNLYYEIGDYPKALEFAKQGMHGLNDRTRDASLFSLADCFLACDSLEQAKTTLLNIHSSKPKMQYAVYRKLSQIAIQLHDAPSAIAYSDSLETATVGMFTNIQQTKDEYYQETLKKELQNERLTYHNQTLRYGVIIIILIVIILVLVSYRRIKSYISRLNESHRLSMLSHETLISELHARIQQFNEQVTQNELALNRYQQLLEQKQNELQQLQLQEPNTQELQVKQQQYEHDIIALKQLYHEEKEQSRTIIKEQQQKITRLQHLLISQTDVYQEIVNGNVRLNDLDSGYWKEVEFVLDSLSNRFATRLKKKYPKMTEEQYHLCLLSRMGLTRNQVSSLMCLAEVTIKKKYHDCKCSVFGMTDSEQNFNDLIAQF